MKTIKKKGELINLFNQSIKTKDLLLGMMPFLIGFSIFGLFSVAPIIEHSNLYNQYSASQFTPSSQLYNNPQHQQNLIKKERTSLPPCTDSLEIHIVNKTSNIFYTINSINEAFFNITLTPEQTAGGLRFIVGSTDVSGHVGGTTGGSVNNINQFQCTGSGSNSTGPFKVYSNAAIDLQDNGVKWGGSFSYSTILISANAFVFENGHVYMRYEITYNSNTNPTVIVLADVTELLKENYSA